MKLARSDRTPITLDRLGIQTATSFHINANSSFTSTARGKAFDAAAHDILLMKALVFLIFVRTRALSVNIERSVQQMSPCSTRALVLGPGVRGSTVWERLVQSPIVILAVESATCVSLRNFCKNPAALPILFVIRARFILLQKNSRPQMAMGTSMGSIGARRQACRGLRRGGSKVQADCRQWRPTRSSSQQDCFSPSESMKKMTNIGSSNGMNRGGADDNVTSCEELFPACATAVL